MRRLGDAVAAFGTRWIPDAPANAIASTLAIDLAALLATAKSPIRLVDAWYGGFWSLLTFAMQLVLIVVTGYGLATASTKRHGNGIRRASRCSHGCPGDRSRDRPDRTADRALDARHVPGRRAWSHPDRVDTGPLAEHAPSLR